MWLLNKNNKKLSSRRQIQIQEVKDNILILPNNQYRMVLETSSVNFELKSDEEQDVLLDTFQNFLNSLPSPIQILVRVREVDVAGYLDQLQKNKQTEKEEVYKNQIDTYSQFIRQVVSGNKILTRRFFVVIPYTHTDKKKDFSVIKEQMHLQRDLVLRGLEKLGMKARTLDSLEVLNLFYAFYNPTQLKTQELKGLTIQRLINEQYV